jgi:hypothetical protein
MTLKTFVDLSGWMAALLILGSYGLNRAWPSVALNVVWVGIGVYALRRNRRMKTT